MLYKMINKLKTGQYISEFYKKAENETAIEGVREGELFWTIKTGKDEYYDTKSEDTVMILSWLIRVEKRLKHK